LLANVPVEMLKVEVVAEAAMVADGGTVSEELEFESVTIAPELGAGWESATVQVVEAFGASVEGLQTRVGAASPTTTAARVTVVFTEELL